MHEVSLIQALFDQVDRAIVPHSSGAVRDVAVRIGALAGVDPDLFRTAFEGCRADRGYAAASLEIVVEDAAWVCISCGASIDGQGPLRCLACQGDARLSKGGDLIVLRVGLEVADV